MKDKLFQRLLQRAEELGGRELRQLVDLASTSKEVANAEALRRAMKRLPALAEHRDRLVQADAALRARVAEAKAALTEAEERLRNASEAFIPTILRELVGEEVPISLFERDGDDWRPAEQAPRPSAQELERPHYYVDIEHEGHLYRVFIEQGRVVPLIERRELVQVPYSTSDYDRTPGPMPGYYERWETVRREAKPSDGIPPLPAEVAERVRVEERERVARANTKLALSAGADARASGQNQGLEKKMEELLKRVVALPMVASANLWEGRAGIRRIYINLRGRDKSFRGCRTHKLFIEDGNLINERGPGMTPRAYDESLEDFIEAWEAIKR